MPRPTSSTAIQRPDLGALAFEYMLTASQRGFIGLDVLPIFEVSEQSADYPVIPIEALLKMPDTRRTSRGAYNRGDWEFETGTYSCVEHGWEEPVDDTEAALYARYFDAEEIAVMRAVDILLRSHEKRVADAVFNTSNITNTANVSTEWSTAASCTPKADVKTAKEAMRVATGLIPNSLVMSEKVLQNLLVCSEIKDYLQYTAPHLISSREAQLQMLAQYFDIGRILIGNAIYDASKKGKTFSITDIWDDEYVLLAVLSSGGKALKEPVLGRTFLWTADSPQMLTTEQYREEQTRSDIHRVRHNVGEAFIFTGAGYLLGNITA